MLILIFIRKILRITNLECPNWKKVTTGFWWKCYNLAIMKEHGFKIATEAQRQQALFYKINMIPNTWMMEFCINFVLTSFSRHIGTMLMRGPCGTGWNTQHEVRTWCGTTELWQLRLMMGRKKDGQKDGWSGEWMDGLRGVSRNCLGVVNLVFSSSVFLWKTQELLWSLSRRRRRRCPNPG